MEQRSTSDPKYQKLATEYAKVRAQAGVLKKAVLDEQAKGTNLRDQLRQRESALRRAEQEVDSLGFRNKQLEHRVAVLQEEIAIGEGRIVNDKTRNINKFAALTLTKNTVAAKNNETDGADQLQNAIMFEELQKKIMENAQLTSLIDDKQRDVLMHTDRVTNLEHALEQRVNEFSELEKRLRRDIDALQNRNSQLEAKFEGATSLLGSEDGLSNTGSENISCLTQLDTLSRMGLQCNHDERIAILEREVAHWRAKCEISQLTNNTTNLKANGNATKKHQQQERETDREQANTSLINNCCCSTSAAGLTVSSAADTSKHNNESNAPPTNEQIMHNRFSNKYEQLLQAKCVAESQLASYLTETQHLQNCLENATHELKSKEEQIQSINGALRMLEDDLTTTRINYEEQISVLTEQVVTLSEQLAACK